MHTATATASLSPKETAAYVLDANVFTGEQWSDGALRAMAEHSYAVACINPPAPAQSSVRTPASATDLQPNFSKNKTFRVFGKIPCSHGHGMHHNNNISNNNSSSGSKNNNNNNNNHNNYDKTKTTLTTTTSTTITTTTTTTTQKRKKTRQITKSIYKQFELLMKKFLN